MMMSQTNAVRVNTTIPIVALIAAVSFGSKIIVDVATIKEMLVEQKAYNLSIDRRVAEIERRLDRMGILSGFEKIDRIPRTDK